MRVRHLIIYIGVLTILLFASCRDKRVYDEYSHTPLAGWEKNDYITFNIPSQKESGNYDLTLQMRTDNSFPFTSVVMIVDEKVFPSGRQFSDTLNCVLTNKRGLPTGNGVHMYQYAFPIRTEALSEGDSLSVSIRHDMKREMLPGISDIGLLMRKAL